MLTGLFAFFLDHSRNAWTGARESMRLFGGGNPPNGAPYSLQTQLGPTSPIGPRVSQPGQWANQTWRWCDFNASSYLNRYLSVLSVFVFVFCIVTSAPLDQLTWPLQRPGQHEWPASESSHVRKASRLSGKPLFHAWVFTIHRSTVSYSVGLHHLVTEKMYFFRLCPIYHRSGYNQYWAGIVR